MKNIATLIRFFNFQMTILMRSFEEQLEIIGREINVKTPEEWFNELLPPVLNESLKEALIEVIKNIQEDAIESTRDYGDRMLENKDKKPDWNYNDVY